jgi:hypothetical protein
LNNSAAFAASMVAGSLKRTIAVIMHDPPLLPAWRNWLHRTQVYWKLAPSYHA